MATANFGLSQWLENVPQIDLRATVPQPIQAFSPLGPGRQPQLIVNAPRAQQALQNKYSGYMRELAAQYDPMLIESMMDFDAQRVKTGQSPLSEAETVAALQAAQTESQPTPEPSRNFTNPLSIARNAVMDIGDIVKAIPRMPLAIAHEAQALSTIPEAMEAGPNPIAALAQAPGIRMIPGSFVVGNLAAGTPEELLRHPVMTALDVLPIANQVAKGTAVARAVEGIVEPARKAEIADIGMKMRDFRRLDRMADRPISTNIMNRVTADGSIIRSPFGVFMDNYRANSRIAQKLTENFSRGQADMMFGLQVPRAELQAVLDGKMAPRTEIEAITKSAVDTINDLNNLEPGLADNATRMAAINDAMIFDDYSKLNDTDMAAMQIMKDNHQQLTDWALDNNRLLLEGGEIYDIKTGTALREARHAVNETTTLHAVRNSILGGDPMDAVQILADRLRAPGKPPGQRGRLPPLERARSIAAGEIGAKELLLSWKGTRQALRNAGYDTTVLDALAVRTRKKIEIPGGGITGDRFKSAINDLIDGRLELPLEPVMSLEDVVTYAKSNYGKSIAYRDLVNGIRRGEWKGVTEAIDTLKKQKDIDPAFLRGIGNARDTARLMDNAAFKRASAEGLAATIKNLESLQLEELPARFKPMALKLTRGKAADNLIEALDPTDPVLYADNVAKILHARDAGELADIPGFSTTMYSSARRESARTIMDMKAKGFDPYFVHTVTTNRVERSLRINEDIVPVTPQATKLRKDNMAPGVRNTAISIHDEALQYASEAVREAELHWIADNFGYTRAELNVMLHEPARYRSGVTEAKNYEAHKADVITERFRELNPEELGYNWGAPYLDQLNSEAIFVPIETYNNLKKLTDPHSILGGIFDPITRTFRIAVTGLSLRTQLYNIVGGGVATTLQSPTALMKYGAEARAMMKDPTLIPQEMHVLMGSGKRTLLELDNSTKGKVIEGVRKYMVGEKMRKWWDQSQATKTPGHPILGRYGEKFDRLVEKSYDINSMFDDFYRMVSYLDEYHKGIAKGYSAEVAGYRAVGTARRILQDYLGMTPFERNVVKSVIPFYGFISHAMRYVLRYPLDHPLRAEFMAKLAAAEMEDHGMGLPTRFMSMLFFGKQDEIGAQEAFNLGPFNPFGDVANTMTVAGFLGNTNPVLQTAFDMVGLTRGKSELYPSLRYDPETGRMAADTPNFAEAFLGNLVPQSGAVLAMLGMNSEYNDMLVRDPTAAGRYLLSTLTVPMVTRQFNVPQEQFAAELARRKSANAVLNQALKSGDWKEAMRYPSLVAYLEALDQLPDDQVAPFQPIDKTQALQMAKDAFAGQVTNQQYTMAGGVPVAPDTNIPQIPLDDLVAAQMGQVALGPSPGIQPGETVAANQAGGALGVQGI